MLSLGGLPPFLGFFLKWASVYFLVGYRVGMVVLMVIMALVSLYYYLRVVYSVYLLRDWGGFGNFYDGLIVSVFSGISLGFLFVFPMLNVFL